ncbi:MAG TPA: hypothetical protein VKK31_17405 [Thermoanaerobaculia bacterium]|nr:hypothetical protein [Thermoanaerobaculia bacterium]
MNKLMRPILMGGLLLLTVLVLPGAVFGQALPTPGAFVRNLDVRCYRIPNLPAAGVPLQLAHLNPVLVNMGLPVENVVLGAPQDFCVPVFKNTIAPPANVLPFIRFVDWKCYGITGPPLNLPLMLNQLNPVIANLLGPATNVIVREPQQLCVPVYKNNAVPPAAVAQLVRFLDVKCYRVDSQPIPSGLSVTLSHLNPLITVPPETVGFLAPPHQLCVPVKKNNLTPPAAVLPIIQFSDVLCYRTSGQPLNLTFNLTHLNPVLAGLPVETVVTGLPSKFCVPVAKNGNFPPG